MFGQVLIKFWELFSEKCKKTVHRLTIPSNELLTLGDVWIRTLISFYFNLKSFQCKSTSKLEIVWKFRETNEFEENVQNFVSFFIWVCNYFSGEVLVNLKYQKMFWNFDGINEFCGTWEVLCSNLIWIKFIDGIFVDCTRELSEMISTTHASRTCRARFI